METFAHESVSLTCQAGGSPPPTIHWLKNGVAISQNSFQNTEQILEELAGSSISDGDLQSTGGSDMQSIGLSSTRSRLFLDCLQPKDSAIYTCVAETPYSRISTDTKLIVTGKTIMDSLSLVRDKLVCIVYHGQQLDEDN